MYCRSESVSSLAKENWSRSASSRHCRRSFWKWRRSSFAQRCRLWAIHSVVSSSRLAYHSIASPRMQRVSCLRTADVPWRSAIWLMHLIKSATPVALGSYSMMSSGFKRVRDCSWSGRSGEGSRDSVHLGSRLMVLRARLLE